MKPGITLKASRRVSVYDLSQPGLSGNGIIDPDFDGEQLPAALQAARHGNTSICPS